MAAINKRRQRNRVSYDILNNLSSVDLFYDKNSKIKGTCNFMYEQNDTNGSFFASYKTFTSPDADSVRPRNNPFSRCLAAFCFITKGLFLMDLDW
jgi:hypothetical protein